MSVYGRCESCGAESCASARAACDERIQWSARHEWHEFSCDESVRYGDRMIDGSSRDVGTRRARDNGVRRFGHIKYGLQVLYVAHRYYYPTCGSDSEPRGPFEPPITRHAPRCTPITCARRRSHRHRAIWRYFCLVHCVLLINIDDRLLNIDAAPAAQLSLTGTNDSAPLLSIACFSNVPLDL